MSNRALGAQFYHGTLRKFRAGDVVVGAQKAGVEENFPSFSDPRYAHASDNPNQAQYWADTAEDEGAGKEIPAL